jgi:hypothetical protein
LKHYFYIIERRGWRGTNDSETADIKLVEDLSTLEDTRRRFSQAILLDLAGGDFVDTDEFKPLDVSKIYDGIQISSWDRFKRHYLFIRGTALLPQRRFVKLGHYSKGGSLEELALRDDCLRLTRELGANINYPYGHLNSNKGMPKDKKTINEYINQSRIGILTTKIEGVNRFKMECLAADIPVLIPQDTSYPTQKHINERTGLFFKPTPDGLAETIEYALSHLEQFSPRDYVLKNTGKENSIQKLKSALKILCEKDDFPYHFDDISWDGRNQSMYWEQDMINLIKQTIEELK